jgi:hypothetical protein
VLLSECLDEGFDYNQVMSTNLHGSNTRI